MKIGDLELSEAMIERVIYGMENQKEKLFLNFIDGQLCNQSSNLEYIVPLPPWGSSEGYYLMVSFARSLPHMPARKMIFNALKNQSGVYKKFKKVLGEYPQIRKLWDQYKYKKMRQTIVSYFSISSEALELEKLENEPLEWSEVPKMSFSVRMARPADNTLVYQMHMEAKAEMKGRNMELYDFLNGQKDVMDFHSYFAYGEEGADLLKKEDGRVYMAEAMGGKIVGLAFYREAVVWLVHVIQEFRGLGIEKILMDNIAQEAGKDGIDHIGIYGCEGAYENEFLRESGFRKKFTLWKKTI